MKYFDTMLRVVLLTVLALLAIQAAEDVVKPDKLSIHTWVREDVFAGWMANDNVAFERGERKLERYLQERPSDPNGLAWQSLAATYRARRARDRGELDVVSKELMAAMEFGKKALAKASSQDIGPSVVIGSTMVMAASLYPESQRANVYREGREHLRKVMTSQGEQFEKLPPHMRGEMWSLLAFASDRLGDTEDRNRVMAEMASKLVGSVYEGRARRWQKLSNLQGEREYMCISCHDPGRLKDTMARVNPPSK